MIKYTIYIISVLFAFSCERDTTWQLHKGESFVVTDCIITNELKYQEVKVYRSSDTLNQPITGISGAQVEITDGSTVYSFSENSGDQGRYLSDEPFRATAGKNYRLTITYSGGTDTAFARMAGVTPLETLNIQPVGEYYRYVLNSSRAGYMLEVFYNWAEVPQYCELYGACQAMEVYYELNNIDAGKIFAPDREEILFPRYTTIVRRKYSLTTQHQQFARSLLLETEWRGGVFDAEAADVPTNFRNGMKGWFAACMVVSDTTRVN